VSAFWSRIVVALVLLPAVLGIVWLGGWWLTSVALVGGLMALHELYVMGRGLRPIVLGGFVGLVLTLLGAQLGGDVTWMLGGMLATALVAFVLYGVSLFDLEDYCDLAQYEIGRGTGSFMNTDNSLTGVGPGLNSFGFMARAQLVLTNGSSARFTALMRQLFDGTDVTTVVDKVELK